MTDQGLNKDTLLKALRSTQQLRSSVAAVFDKLGESGGPSNITSECIDKEKQLLTDLRDRLFAVGTDTEDLEKVSGAIPNQYPPLALGNPSLLSVDPSTDKTSLSAHVVHTYKWSTKVQRQAHLAFSLLSDQVPKRSPSTGSLLGKRSRSNASSSANYTLQQMEVFIQSNVRGLQDFSVTLARPFGSLTVLQVTVARTLKAVVILRGLIVEAVVVRAFHEDTHTERSKTMQLDLWTPSRYAVFQKVTASARAAMMYFSSVSPEPIIVRPYLTWLHSYRTLFSSPCIKCKKILNDLSPPTFRDFRALEPYHEGCRP